MKKSKITAMIEMIKTFFFNSNGALLLKDNLFEGSIHEYYIEIIGDIEMKKLSEDKKNMRNDGLNIKKDIKKSIKDYHSEVVNG